MRISDWSSDVCSSDLMPKFGWIIALAHAVCCALRLARFNANIDADDQPHKSAGFMTGVPAPAGAGLAFAPVYLWLSTGLDIFRAYYIVGDRKSTRLNSSH